MAIREYEMVVLTHDVPGSGLARGDVGCVVHVHAPEAFEVEFTTGDGRTVALLTLTTADVRPQAMGEVLHVREYALPVTA